MFGPLLRNDVFISILERGLRSTLNSVLLSEAHIFSSFHLLNCDL